MNHSRKWVDRAVFAVLVLYTVGLISIPVIFVLDLFNSVFGEGKT